MTFKEYVDELPNIESEDKKKIEEFFEIQEQMQSAQIKAKELLDCMTKKQVSLAYLINASCKSLSEEVSEKDKELLRQFLCDNGKSNK